MNDSKSLQRYELLLRIPSFGDIKLHYNPITLFKCPLRIPFLLFSPQRFGSYYFIFYLCSENK